MSLFYTVGLRVNLRNLSESQAWLGAVGSYQCPQGLKARAYPLLLSITLPGETGPKSSLGLEEDRVSRLTLLTL